MKVFVVIAALAAVGSAAPGHYANLRSAALPLGLGYGYAAPAATITKVDASPELKTIKVDEVEASAPAAISYASPLGYAAYGHGYGLQGYAGHGFAGYGYAAAPVTVKAAEPIELKTIKVEEVEAAPIAYAAPAVAAVHAAPAVAYAAPVAVKAAVAPVAVQTYAAAPTVVRQEVEIPVTKTVHYADEQVVTGHTTSIHKPNLAAPAIAAPRVLVGKTINNPATVSVEKYAAEVKTINHVPEPYDVPYDVPAPYAVPTPVHTAPVEVRKRVYAAPVHTAPVAVAAHGYAAAAPVAVAAHGYAAVAPAAVAVEAAPAAVEVKAAPAAIAVGAAPLAYAGHGYGYAGALSYGAHGYAAAIPAAVSVKAADW